MGERRWEIRALILPHVQRAKSVTRQRERARFSKLRNSSAKRRAEIGLAGSALLVRRGIHGRVRSVKTLAKRRLATATARLTAGPRSVLRVVVALRSVTAHAL